MPAPGPFAGDLEGCGGPGSGVPGPCPGPKDIAKQEGKVKRATVAVQKAKDGLVKAKKDLKDMKAAVKEQKAQAKAASGKARAKAPVDPGEHGKATVAFQERLIDPKTTVADIEKHVEGLGKALNKGQMLATAKMVDINRTLKTKAEAQKAIRQKFISIKGTWDRKDA